MDYTYQELQKKRTAEIKADCLMKAVAHVKAKKPCEVCNFFGTHRRATRVDNHIVGDDNVVIAVCDNCHSAENKTIYQT